MQNEIKNLNQVLKSPDTPTPNTDFIEKVANFLGTNIYVIGLTVFLMSWIGINTFLDFSNHKAFDPYPFLFISTAINIYSAYTMSILLKADKAQREREQVKHDYEFGINKQIFENQKKIITYIQASHTNLKQTIINKRTP